MYMSYKISVIIPVFNSGKYIERCLDSVVNQTYKNLQIIVINDGSTDNSLEMILPYMELDHRIEVINQINQGVSKARNVGLQKVDGDFVSFVDSDDWIESEMLEKMLQENIRTKADIVVCNYSVDNNIVGQPALKLPTEKISLLENKNFIIGDYLDGKYKESIGYSAWNKLYKRHLTLDVQFEDNLSIGEDLLFNLNVFQKVNSISFLNIPLYHYVVNSSSAINSYKSDMCSRYQKTIEELETYVRKFDGHDVLANALKQWIFEAFIFLLYNERKGARTYKQLHKGIQQLVSNKFYREETKKCHVRKLSIRRKAIYLLYRCKLTFLITLAVKGRTG